MNDTPLSRIGIFAGTFDPIHDGHTSLITEAVNTLELNSVMVLIEEKPWGSKQPQSLNHRQNMAEIALQSVEKTSLFREVGAHFTIDKTLPKLESEFQDSELYFMFGADVFMRMSHDTWPGLEQLLKHYIVVFERAGITEHAIAEYAKSLGIVVAIISSKYPDHSSTDVRININNRQLWLDKDVAAYIEANALY